MAEWISILIPVAVVLLAIATKRIIPSLMTGIIAGGIALSNGNILQGVTQAADHIIQSAATEESMYIVFFLFLFGSFAEIMKVSGGIKGFTQLTEKHVKSERGALASVWAVTPVTFIDCCFHAIAAGTIAKALNEKVKGNRRRLAFVLNVTSCLLIILIPFGTTYVGYIMGVIASSLNKAGISESAYELYLRSIPFNFYSIVMLLLSIVVVLYSFGFKREYASEKDEEQFDKEHGHDEAHEQCSFEQSAPARPLNLALPLLFLIISTVFFLWMTGQGVGITGFWNAIRNADFERSIFISAMVTIILTCIFYLFQKIPLRELESHFLSGGNEMLPPIVVLLLSWGLASIIEELGFIRLVTGILSSGLPEFLIPAGIYLIASIASYFMGTAWGTWALIMPMAIPLAVSTGNSIPLMIGAVLAGGAFGDNASPLGETAILSAAISDIPVMEHVRSELPFCLAGVAASVILFLVFAL